MTELVARFDVLGNFASIYVGKMLSCLRPRVVHLDIVHFRKKSWNWSTRGNDEMRHSIMLLIFRTLTRKLANWYFNIWSIIRTWVTTMRVFIPASISISNFQKSKLYNLAKYEYGEWWQSFSPILLKGLNIVTYTKQRCGMKGLTNEHATSDTILLPISFS